MYGSGHRLLLLVAVAGAFLQWGYTVTILCAVDFLWALLFISRGCSVMWVQVLRLGVGGGGVAAGLCKSLEAAAVTWSLCIVLAVVLGARQHFNRRNERRQIDCFLLLTRLQSLVGRLALWGDRSSAKLALRADCTAHDGAFMLLEIEARLPIERLHPGFVRTRAAWRQRLWEQSYDFNAVLESARELDRAFYVPPSAVQLKRMLDQVRGGRGIPEWLAQEVLDFVGKAQGQRMHIVGKPAARTASWFLDSWVLRHLWKMSRDEIQYGLVSRQKESAPQQQQLAAPRQVGTSRSSSGLGGADRARRNDNEPVAVVLGRARSNLGTASWRGMMQDAVEEVGNGEYVPASKANLQSRQSSSNSIVDTI